jgi:hypothetical protein
MKSIITSVLFTLSVIFVSGQQLSILPISLKNFSVALKNENTIEVKWDIIHQNNASGYSIEHSVDSKNWQPVGFVSQITNDSYKNFTYTHENPGTGLHYYRIHLIDKDEKPYYSEVKIISLKTNIKVSLWPNPSHDYLHLQYNDIKRENTKAVILNQNGVKVKEVSLHPGINRIDIQQLSAGIYFVYMNREAKGNSIIRFIKN